MNALRFKKGTFRIARLALDGKALADWAIHEGRSVHQEIYERTPVRWFLGRWRARQVLVRDARRALRPGAPFAVETERRLGQLQSVVRAVAAAIQRRGHRDLVTVEEERWLIVIPRAVVQSDFRAFLVKELGDAETLRALPGLARRALSALAAEAEVLLFRDLARGRDHVDESGRGALLGVDAEFRWRLGSVDGHYYYGHIGVRGADLGGRGRLRSFKSKMREVRQGQDVHLRRLPSHERAAIAEALRI
ncbi:MAG: hypothetical protein OEO21_02955 [Candidatus Krumholzibacteria bacterium]|nr:hypothetical protein [Candidatus Krumholzibacteria bacterium]